MNKWKWIVFGVIAYVVWKNRAALPGGSYQDQPGFIGPKFEG
jgi:hypothetical protein